MSLEVRYRTQIVVPQTQLVAQQGNFLETPCGELLRRALEKVAREQRGHLAISYSDNEGLERRVPLAIRTADFPRGIGVEVGADGRVTFRYDAYGPGAAIGRTLCDEITQTYAVLAVMRAQARYGFQVTVEEQTAAEGKKRVVVRGVVV